VEVKGNRAIFSQIEPGIFQDNDVLTDFRDTASKQKSPNQTTNDLLGSFSFTHNPSR
jgi:hypothetical protein